VIVTRRISLAKLLRFTWPNLCALLAFGVLAMLATAWLPGESLRALSYAAGFMGTALAFLIGFRNNSAYARWWEGHRIWSKLKYDSRSFATLLLGLVRDPAVRQRLIHRQAAFAWRLNRQLRRQSPGDELTGLLEAGERERIEQSRNPALALLKEQAEELSGLLAAGQLDSYQHLQLMRLQAAFQEALAGSERLKNIPFPMQYTWFMRYSLLVFLFIMPLSLAGHLAYWSLPVALLIGYAFVLLEYVGRYIENPFENDVNDVPLDYLSRGIEIDLRELLGETALPEPVRPVGLGYLY